MEGVEEADEVPCDLPGGDHVPASDGGGDRLQVRLQHLVRYPGIVAVALLVHASERPEEDEYLLHGERPEVDDRSEIVVVSVLETSRNEPRSERFVTVQSAIRIGYELRGSADVDREVRGLPLHDVVEHRQQALVVVAPGGAVLQLVQYHCFIEEHHHALEPGADAQPGPELHHVVPVGIAYEGGHAQVGPDI